MNLNHLITQGESATLELKQSFDKEAIETVCAFANAKGGNLLIGVADNGDIKGIQNYPTMTVYEESGDGFMVTVGYEQQKHYTETTQETTQETAQETAQETTAQKILVLLKENPKMTRKELVTKLNKADGTIKQHIENLKESGQLKRVGSTKSGSWLVIKKENEKWIWNKIPLNHAGSIARKLPKVSGLRPE